MIFFNKKDFDNELSKRISTSSRLPSTFVFVVEEVVVVDVDVDVDGSGSAQIFTIELS